MRDFCSECGDYSESIMCINCLRDKMEEIVIDEFSLSDVLSVVPEIRVAYENLDHFQRDLILEKFNRMLRESYSYE